MNQHLHARAFSALTSAELAGSAACATAARGAASVSLALAKTAERFMERAITRETRWAYATFADPTVIALDDQGRLVNVNLATGEHTPLEFEPGAMTDGMDR